MVASQDENREVPSPEAVCDLSTNTHHMGNKCPVLQDYHHTAITGTVALRARLGDHQQSFGLVPPGFQENKISGKFQYFSKIMFLTMCC